MGQGIYWRPGMEVTSSGEVTALLMTCSYFTPSRLKQGNVNAGGTGQHCLNWGGAGHVPMVACMARRLGGMGTTRPGDVLAT